jgi:hypothetical protein
MHIHAYHRMHDTSLHFTWDEPKRGKSGEENVGYF